MRNSGYAYVLAVFALALAGIFLASGNSTYAYAIAVIGLQLIRPFLGQKESEQPPARQS